MVLAAIEDLRRLVIPNALTLSLCVLWPLYVLATPTLIATLGSLACAAIVFLVGALSLFARLYRRRRRQAVDGRRAVGRPGPDRPASCW